jgi:hypothetical protein
MSEIAAHKTLLTATIAESASLSDAVYLGESLSPFAIKMPAAWDAAAITLQTSLDGSAWSNVYIAGGTEYSVTVAAANWVMLDPTYLKGLGSYIKVRSGTAGSPVNQTAARSIGVYVQED